MRDWTKYTVFERADRLVVEIYKDSQSWPRAHMYGLTQQVQRAAVSIASNIVEGCSRQSDREFARFIEIAYASACEVQYQLSVAKRVFFDPTEASNLETLERDAVELCKLLGSFHRRLVPGSGPEARS